MTNPPQDEELLFGVLTACESKDKLEKAEQRIHINQLENIGYKSYYRGSCFFKAQGLSFRLHVLDGLSRTCREKDLTMHLESCTALDQEYHMNSYNLVLSDKAPALERKVLESLRIGGVDHSKLEQTIYERLLKAQVLEVLVFEVSSVRTRIGRYHGYSVTFQIRPANEITISARREDYNRWIQKDKLLPIAPEKEGSKHEVSWDSFSKAKFAIKNQMPQAPLFDLRNGYGTRVFHERNAKFMPQRADVTYTKDAAMLPHYSYNCTPALRQVPVEIPSRSNTTGRTKSKFSQGSRWKAALRTWTHLGKTHTAAEKEAPQTPGPLQRPKTSSGSPSMLSSGSHNSSESTQRPRTTRSSSMSRPQTSGSKPRVPVERMFGNLREDVNSSKCPSFSSGTSMTSETVDTSFSVPFLRAQPEIIHQVKLGHPQFHGNRVLVSTENCDEETVPIGLHHNYNMF